LIERKRNWFATQGDLVMTFAEKLRKGGITLEDKALHKAVSDKLLKK
jgi:hypothetical protein